MSIRFRVTGARAMQQRIRQLAQRFPDVVGRAMREEAEIEMAESKRRVPVDTGALRASGHVDGPSRAGRALTVTLGYGGPAAPYAVAVHENLEAFHRVGQAKYLESVLDESLPHLAGRIGARVQRALGT